MILIKYRFYDEQSIFLTNWQALRWTWVNHYRGAAYNQQNIDEDYKLATYLAKNIGEKVEARKDFVGFESTSMMAEEIILNPEELLNFD